MLKIIAAILATVALTINNQYPATMKVIEINRETDMVTLEDFNGYLWQFYGAEDWEVNDICSCIMNDNGTENILDDEIVDVRYSGYIEGWVR